MTLDQTLILSILAASVGLFLWGRWRHDMVALAALLACVFTGLIPGQDAFAGFGHGAVITVACVLVLSRGLQSTGAIDVLAQKLLPKNAGLAIGAAMLTALGAFLSAFMNNVGALALLMPVAIQLARKQEVPPGVVLMPLAFGTILGGMTTLIGTPPNLIVSGFRADLTGEPFRMFDYSPVGALVALTGVVFITVIGWRLVPRREPAGAESFDTGHYLTEVRVTEKNKVVGKPLREAEDLLDKDEAQIVGLVRNDLRVQAPNPARVLRAGDILVLEAEPEALSAVLSSLGLALEEDVETESDDEAEQASAPTSEDEESEKESGDDSGSALQEWAALPGSTLLGRSASDIRLRTRFGINLLAVSRQGKRSVKRLRSIRVRAGDVLLLQGSSDAISAFGKEFGCIPLAERSIGVPDKGKAALGVSIMGLAILAAAIGWVPAAVAFAAGVLGFMVSGVLPMRSMYEAIDWPVIVLLAAMIPVAGVMASTGAADLLAQLLLENVAGGNAIVAVVLLMVITMTLSDFMNNAATAAVMCQIAISSAAVLSVNPDTLLMAVAIGASCSFLTPIGHQNNTLILGPGGFRFGDYWRLGLPMEIIVVLVGTPLLLWVWPL
ncbi:di/tricarboxylate transporter [Marinimicrobium koreense]|uniref:Di/tricarboxylate transporter n=1 Tax=Marinimicrobium koreense TaxID=306545 RepID=A0A3N1NRD5_9GAMM|nr:SLC13 family permease [Marinimicrobium koreense]ROQ18439.1 di/tricarboxylate transporter [Marinimicrobium koreense]